MKKNTWIILGLVVVLGAIYFFTKQDKVSVGVKHLQLAKFDKAQVDRIEISGKNKATLIKEKDTWMLEMGEADQKRLVGADPAYVTAMLNAASELKPSYYVTQLTEKQKELGLDAESATAIVLKSGEKTLWALNFGNNASNGGRYAKLPENNDIYVVKAQFWQLIRNNAVDWRNRSIVAMNDTDIRVFKLETSTHTFNLVKKEENEEWGFGPDQVLPPSFRVNKSALAGMVKAAASLRASGFIDEEKPLLQALATISITDKDKKEISFKVYPGENDKYLVVVGGKSQIFEIQKSNFDRINRGLEDLRDLTIMNFDPKDIVKLALADKAGRVLLEKKEDKWHIIEPKTLAKGFEFDEKSPDDIVSIAHALSGARLADPKKDIAVSAQWKEHPLIELTDAKGVSYKVLAGKSKTKGEYLVKGNADENIYVVSEGKLSALTTGIETFKKIEYDLPAIDEQTKGFEGLPVEVQRQLLDAAKKKMQK